MAKDSGVSVGTISRYLNGKNVRPENIQKIEDSIKKLNYSINYNAKSLKTNQSYAIGVIVPHVTDMFSNYIIEAIDGELEETNYSLMICSSRNDLSTEKEKIDFLIERNVDGIVIMPVSNESTHVNEAIKANIPVVVVDRKIDEVNCDFVSSNNLEAGYEVASKLVNLGHKKIGVISGQKNVSTAKDRLEGFLKAFKDLSIPYDERMIEFSIYEKGGGKESIERLLSNNEDLTAIFATNYEITLTCMDYFKTSNMEIGEKISLFGFDDNDLFRLFTPTIATVRQPMKDIGKIAIKILLERIKNNYTEFPVNIELDVEIIDGKSIKTINGGIN